MSLGKFTVPLQRPARFYGLVSWPLFFANVSVAIISNFAFARTGSPKALWALDTVMISYLVLPLVLAAMLSLARWALPQANPEQALPLQVERRRQTVLFAQVLLFTSILSLSVKWLVQPGPRFTAPAILLSTAIVIFIFFRRLRKLNQALGALGSEPAIGTQQSGWHWGRIIYYAPNDPALFVPKFRGYGMTLNFARPLSWALVGALVLFSVALVWAVRG